MLQHKFGFTPAKSHSSDHRWYELKLDGLPTILTKVSHSRDPINKCIEGKTAKQLRVKKQYYEGMMSCSNSRDNYYQQVRKDPFPPFNILF
ncbi:hypothetical protein KSU1_C1105 [Candidatus Jettenia caeni]|uniref:Uncharacterized protein n=1 Tax=Candidatus Jettenia caeni TaxID=247490 RepID=I3ILV6_9BACT|nr:hypothetical protein [Candidatus Jettenia sp. AMX1]KAA0249479.1 MAG: hypothetical protein EDM77_08795 [Candidatus Jettenia sp. AMX1]MCQ3925982.1 hypothetical protein [Candidatus Jettenia sp.]WKZ14461.1 MAG: hypothetical protein QY317_11155 [Candidatus Jettenia caeni]GAB62701.1 hypothetical protein KSU1_C1105 [Candidatus Jettenia caeni]